jgi:hypothetical protein
MLILRNNKSCLTNLGLARNVFAAKLCVRRRKIQSFAKVTGIWAKEGISGQDPNGVQYYTSPNYKVTMDAGEYSGVNSAGN